MGRKVLGMTGSQLEEIISAIVEERGKFRAALAKEPNDSPRRTRGIVLSPPSRLLIPCRREGLGDCYAVRKGISP